MKKIVVVLGLVLLFFVQNVFADSSSPSLKSNSWNFIFVPLFEGHPTELNNNNLSTTGLNHSLRFAQLLNTITAGKAAQIQDIYALSGPDNSTDMKPLESIEPFAVLNNRAINAQTLAAGDASVYNSPGYFIEQLLAEQPRGLYVMAMPESLMQEMVKAMTGSRVAKQNANHYLVVSGDSKPFTVNIYQDNITPVTHYPQVQLPRTEATCPQPPVTITAKKPVGLKSYNNQSVYFIRHVEAHPNTNFENGNYICQGQWRALGCNAILRRKMGGRIPDYIFTSNPANIISCVKGCSYIRPALTVAPFAIQHQLPLTLAPFQWEDAVDLSESLFNQNSPYFNDRKQASSILVGWEHVHIEEAVKYLFATIYNNPEAAAKVPSWNFQDYDTIWQLTTDKNGNLEFKNTCEGIASEDLPSTCPSFFPE